MVREQLRSWWSGCGQNLYGIGSVLHIYFNDFADHLDLRRCIRFNTRVLGVEKLVHDQDQGQGWRITAQMTDPEQASQPMTMAYYCKKLIISMRLATNPRPISIKGQEDFGRPILNQAQLGDQANKLAQDPTVNSVMIIGASNIGYDAVYLLALHEKKVEWTIRESGGALWICSLWVFPLATMRFCSWFSPRILGGIR